MGLLAKLRSLLGRDRETGSTPGATPEVTVERETSGSAPSRTEEDAATGGEEPTADGETTADEAATAGADAGDTADEGGEDAAAPTGAAGESVENIKGIGPAYSDRLAQVGIEVVDDLADADPAAVAAETDLSAARIENWVEQARARTREA